MSGVSHFSHHVRVLSLWVCLCMMFTRFCIKLVSPIFRTEKKNRLQSTTSLHKSCAYLFSFGYWNYWKCKVEVEIDPYDYLYLWCKTHSNLWIFQVHPWLLLVVTLRFSPYQPGSLLDLSVTIARDCPCNPYEKRSEHNIFGYLFFHIHTVKEKLCLKLNK